MVVILATAHGSDIPGKCSPKDTKDGVFKEWKWSRKICFMLKYLLLEYYKYNNDFDCVIDIIEQYEDKNMPTTKKKVGSRIKRCKEIQMSHNGTKTSATGCILLTIHVNAGDSGDWVKSRGWGMWLNGAPIKDENDKIKGYNEHSQTKDCDRELCSTFYHTKDIVNQKTTYDLNGTCGVKKTAKRYSMGQYGIVGGAYCPSAMSENFLQDNKEDVKFLRSEEGEKAVLTIHLNAIVAYLKNYCNYTRRIPTNILEDYNIKIDNKYPLMEWYIKERQNKNQTEYYNHYLKCGIAFDFTEMGPSVKSAQNNEGTQSGENDSKNSYSITSSSAFPLDFTTSSKTDYYKVIYPKGGEACLTTYTYFDAPSPRTLVFDKFPILTDSEISTIINRTNEDKAKRFK